MAVITHAHTRPETDYYALPATLQDAFDELMEQADQAGTTDHFLTLMARAASLTGIRLPASGDIRRCACSCICGCIFDAEDPDAHVIEWTDGYNLGRLQCPTCHDRHSETA
ncbi:hypothetical protein [Streptomyces sp. NBRC 110035]|uniref:hypothetical protein n=1 Tax=Streptomyces sp. NBRC 110035 TaxID=1547867 RepID=UPI0005A8CE2C|nr:hypothetical protein [Streptomyces sp. NBRC 110035]